MRKLSGKKERNMRGENSRKHEEKSARIMRGKVRNLGRKGQET